MSKGNTWTIPVVDCEYHTYEVRAPFNHETRKYTNVWLIPQPDYIKTDLSTGNFDGGYSESGNFAPEADNKEIIVRLEDTMGIEERPNRFGQGFHSMGIVPGE
jgi:hypothetical protein